MPSYTIAELAKLIQAEVKGDSQAVITGIAPIATASKGHLTYLIGGRYQKYLQTTAASAVVVSSDNAADCISTALIVKNPEAAFAKIAALFDTYKKPKPGICANVTLGENCKIHPSVAIGASSVIGNGVNIGANTIIAPGTVIGDECSIGENCILNANATLYHGTIVANNVIIHSGAVIGADGFGFAQGDEGQWVKIPQLGRVIIEDDVEIGANTAIDRGALQDTLIRRGVKIDNCVQIGHNVEIGEHTIIAGCAGIAGSTKIGKYCMIGGGCRINGHITITDQVILAASASVLNSITESGIYSSGTEARPHREWIKTVVRIHQLDEIAKRLKKLENSVANSQA